MLTGTLKTIHDRGTILIGVRDSSIPFSFLNKARQPIGFSVDLCHGIADGRGRRVARSDLLEPDAPAWQKGVRIVYVPVAADERLPKVISGAVDLECGSTTATPRRARNGGVLAGVLPGGHEADGPEGRRVASTATSPARRSRSAPARRTARS